MTEEPASRRLVVAVELVVLVGLCTLLLVRAVEEGGLVDDAFITYRYARHLVEGYGLAWNVGEPWVEGFSSPLWMLLMAAGYAAGLQPPVWSVLLGGALSVGLIVLCWWTTRAWVDEADPRLGKWAGGVWGLGAATALALSPSLTVWTFSGMEAPLAALLFLLTAERLATSTRGTSRWAGVGCGVAAGLAVWTRTEGLFLLPTLALAALLTSRRPGHRLRNGPTTALAVATGLVALLLTCRLLLFGELLPNTFYAKQPVDLLAHVPSGLAYTHAFLALHPALVLVPVAGALLVWRNRAVGGPLLLLVALHVAGVVYMGGDWMSHSRFLVPVLPVMVVMVAAALGEVWTLALSRRRRAARLATAGALALLGTGAVLQPHLWPGEGVTAQERRSDRQRARALMWRTMAHRLAQITEPDDMIALRAVGIVGYYTDRPLLDLHGLNEPTTAHLDPTSGPRRIGHQRFGWYQIVHRAPQVMTKASVPLDKAPVEVREVIEEQYVPYGRLLLRADVADRIIAADKRWRRASRRPRR